VSATQIPLLHLFVASEVVHGDAAELLLSRQFGQRLVHRLELRRPMFGVGIPVLELVEPCVVQNYRDDAAEKLWLLSIRALVDRVQLKPAPGESHEAQAFFQVAVAGQERQSFLDKGLWIERDEVGLVPVDALVVGRIKVRGFLPAPAQDS